MSPKLRGQQRADSEVQSAASETTERNVPTAVSTTIASGDTAINALAGMFQVFMQFQKERIERQEREMSRREQQFKVFTHQINQLADVDNSRHGVMAAERSAVRTLGYGSALPKLQEDNDIEQYLTTFERLAEVYLWPKADWEVHFVPLLVGKA